MQCTKYLCFILGCILIVTVSANPVERVKRAYDYTPPEGGEPEGLFDNVVDPDDNQITVVDVSEDGNSIAIATVSKGDAPSGSSNDVEFVKPIYNPNCCASCTCT